ncbi:MAG: biosynthetic-type acetolactate synthase large subunit [Anaerovoracaceae bacterium]
MKISGSKIIMECLREQGVDTIFGYPGGQIMPLYNALYDYHDEITHVLTAHEQGATHAADGYARSTGKVGVAFATSGPGATNTVTGIATAFMDSVPMVVITGQVPRALIGRDSFQEVDIAGITIPVTKHNYFVSDIVDLADTVREAFSVARSGRQGPVLIDVPKDILVELYDYEPKIIDMESDIDNLYDINDIKCLANKINTAKRPLIYAGGGVISAEASDKLVKLAEKANIPVVSTLMNLGAIPRTHELSLGLVGMHGQKEANLAVNKSDLLIAVGARFSDRVTGNVESFAKNAEIVQIDIDNSEIDKNVTVNHNIVGEINAILTAVLELIKDNSHEEWLKEISDFRIDKFKDETAFIPENILSVIQETIGDDVIVTTDVGQHQMWTAQFWKFTEPRTFITSGGLGTMGFGLGAAIGAQMAKPESRVVHITGDGSFRMNCNEMATVSANKLPIISILFKNNVLGMVRQWQKLFFDKRYSATTLPDVVDYEKLAEAYGLKGYSVNTLEGLRQALRAAIESKSGNLIVCDINSDDDVFPIVPPGNAISDQVMSTDEL